jgi:hypothetical protein
MEVERWQNFKLGDGIKEVQLRPAGKKVPLAEIFDENPLLFAQLLGTVPFVKSAVIFSVLKDHHHKMGDEDFDHCKFNHEIMINLEICKWCQNFQTCSLLESNREKARISIDLYGVPKGSTVNVLSMYFSSKYKGEDGGEEEEEEEHSIIFCDSSDPFFPQSRDKVTKNLVLFNPSKYIIPFTDGKQCWHHLFFSPLLKRTLCVFEAQIIELMSHDKSFRKMSKRNAFPTGDEVKEFLSSTTDLSEFNISEFISSNEKIGTWVSHINAYMDTGLYKPAVELFTNYSIGDTIEVNLSNYIIEIIDAINFADDKLLQVQSVAARKACILYVPGGYEQELGLSFSHQITRIVELDGLEEVLVLVDTETKPIGRTKEKYSQLISKEFWNRTIDIPESLKYIFENSQLNTKIIDWRKITRERPLIKHIRLDETIAIVPVYTAWFSPKEYYSALSYHLRLRQTAASSGDKEYYSMRKTLSLFFEYFYPIIEEDLELERFRDSFKEPQNRRLKGYDIMLKLSLDPRFKPYLSFDSIPNYAERTTLETFIFTSSTLKDEDSQTLKWTFERVITELKAKDGHNNNASVFSFSKSGVTDDLNLLGLGNKLANALSWNPNQKHIITTKGGGIWLSEKILQLIEEGFVRDYFDFGHFVVDRHREWSHGRVMCISLSGELEYIKSLTGDSSVSRSIQELNFEINEIEYKICIWNPETAVNETSPNTFMSGR